jgi:predicted HicB family RNase H-like nuclease
MSRLSKVFDKAKESSLENKEETKQESKKTRKQEVVNINFKVDVETRRKIKQYAAKHDKSLKEVFETAIEFYIENHP